MRNNEECGDTPRESGPGVEGMGPEVEETAHFDHRQAAGGVGVCAIRGVV